MLMAQVGPGWFTMFDFTAGGMKWASIEATETTGDGKRDSVLPAISSQTLTTMRMGNDWRGAHKHATWSLCSHQVALD